MGGDALCPGAGLLIMAIEAVTNTLTGQNISGFRLREAHFLAPVKVGQTIEDAVETETQLRPLTKSFEKITTRFEVRIFTRHEEQWTECFRTRIEIELESADAKASDHIADAEGNEALLAQEKISQKVKLAMLSCTQPVQAKDFYAFCADNGLAYGNNFQLLDKIHWDGQDTSTGRVRLISTPGTDSPVHPAVVDGLVQLLFTQITEGIDRRVQRPTLVPQRLSRGWISAKLWDGASRWAYTSSVSRRSESRIMSFDGTVYALGEDGSVLCELEDLMLTEIRRPNHNERGPPADMLYGIRWKPQLSALHSSQLHKVCDNRVVGFTKKSIGHYLPRLEFAMGEIVQRALWKKPDNRLDYAPDHLRKYAHAMTRLHDRKRSHVPRPIEANQLSDTDLYTILDDCTASLPELGLFSTVARALPSIIECSTDPLQLIFETQAAEKYYARKALSEFTDNDQLHNFLDLKSHENPSMRILEVGAGTGAFTHHILKILRSLENSTGTARYAEYAYTDLSPGYFNDAHERFHSNRDNRLHFQVLDLEQEPGLNDDGLANAIGNFDVVIAASVLHATSSLKRTLKHLSMLMKPGAHLILQEVVFPDIVCINAVFGLLPGWWLSTEEWRQSSPLATEERWAELLTDSEFSGLDLIIKDEEKQERHMTSIMISTFLGLDSRQETYLDRAISQANHKSIGPLPLHVVIESTSNFHCQVARDIVISHPGSQVICLDQPRNSSRGGLLPELLIFLTEFGTPRLGMLTEDDFECIRTQIQNAQKILWVASGSKGSSIMPDPHCAISTGLFRTLRNEETNKHIVTLIIESCAPGDEIDFIKQVAWSCFAYADDRPGCQEVEFIVREGLLTVGRMVKEVQLNQKLISHRFPKHRNEALGPSAILALGFEAPGLLDSLRFIEDCNDKQGCLEPDAVEIKATHWGLNFRDLFIALGRMGTEKLGIDCAGVVTRIGSNVSARGSVLQPGDRVVMMTPGCMRTHPQAPFTNVVKVPDDLPVETAIGSVCPIVTAYYSLMSIARLERGERVLIHSGAGATGQVAVMLSQMVGAEVFVTVGANEKREFLTKELGIPNDHIFYSRNESFRRGIMRMTNNHGVDVSVYPVILYPLPNIRRRFARGIFWKMSQLDEVLLLACCIGS